MASSSLNSQQWRAEIYATYVPFDHYTMVKLVTVAVRTPSKMIAVIVLIVEENMYMYLATAKLGMHWCVSI